jgi:exodeoxyribonuclease-1
VSFIFYDTETSGTDVFFDQILQFAAIRTDDELKERERFEMRCRLQAHVVPAPEAMRLCGTRAARLNDPTLPSHYEMVREIRGRLLGWSPALFVGWNSIKFDESLLRQALYQTLHPPYLTNTAGNSRSDAMRLVQASSVHAPGALAPSANGDGITSFRLAAVAAANGFRCERAHDAMADAEATLHLCRILAQAAPELWSSFMRFSTKAAVTDFIKAESVFGVTTYYGRAYSHLVTAIAPAPENPAEWYVYDLGTDPGELKDLTEAELLERLSNYPKPVRRLKANESPSLFTYDNAPECCAARVHDLTELEGRAASVSKESDLGQRLMAAMAKLRVAFPPSEHVEQQIYAGFFPKDDEALMESFHRAPWGGRPAIVERFRDQRLKKLGLRLLHAEQPELLDSSSCDAHDRNVAHRVLGIGNAVPWLTLPKAITQLEALLETATEDEAVLLREHHALLCGRHARARTRLGIVS